MSNYDNTFSNEINEDQPALVMFYLPTDPRCVEEAPRMRAAARELEFDNSTDRLIVSGDADIRDRLLPLLRKYVSYVMPMIFPSDIFKLGRDALNAPFELIAIPLLD